MAPRRPLAVVCLAVLSMGASYRTTNFIANAPTPQIAQQIGEAAEQYRREKALTWLGREMPAWPEPCPLTAKVTMTGAGGATSFAFDRGRVLGQQMNIEGSLDRLVSSVLPHEVTHTVFAHYFRTPVPRWADEGGAVFSEDDIERNRHDMLCRQILNTPGRAMPLRRLFGLREYPPDVMALYAQGFSVTSFLVGISNRQQFLGFVATGMNQGWDAACQSYYHYRSVEELEQAWLTHMRNTRRTPVQLAANPNTPSAPAQIAVRLTAPPAQPILTGSGAIYRGATPDDQPNQRFGDMPGQPARLPDYPAPAARLPAMPVPASPGWQPASSPPTVQLGPPQFVYPPQ